VTAKGSSSTCRRCSDAPDIVAILLASAKAAFDGALKSVGTKIRVKLRVMTPPPPGWEHTLCRLMQGAINKITVARFREGGIFSIGARFFDRDRVGW
jgi:hypothetical protein